MLRADVLYMHVCVEEAGASKPVDIVRRSSARSAQVTASSSGQRLLPEPSCEACFELLRVCCPSFRDCVCRLRQAWQQKVNAKFGLNPQQCWQPGRLGVLLEVRHRSSVQAAMPCQAHARGLQQACAYLPSSGNLLQGLACQHSQKSFGSRQVC